MAESINMYSDNVTMGNVFDNTFSLVREIFEELEGYDPNETGENNGQSLVPDTCLEFKRESGRGLTGTTYRTTLLSCIVNGARNPLLTLDTDTLPGETEQTPAAVGGFRANETFGDYSIKKGVFGLITSKLSRIGQVPPTQPDQTNGYKLPETFTGLVYTRLGELSALQRYQLRIVRTGILNNVAVVEHLREGQPEEEVFRSIGRQLITG